MQMRYDMIICIVLFINLGSCDGPGKPEASSAKVPELLWKYEGLGRGYGAPCVFRNRIFVNAEKGGNSYTVCLEMDGTFRWKSPNGKEFVGMDYSASFPGTRSSPTVTGGQVYAASGMGHLSCFDLHNGNIVWNVDLVKEFNGIPGDFGYSESPVVDKQKVYCFTGAQVHNLVALDRNTGQLVWSVPVKKDAFSYSTPLLLTLPERDILVGTSRNYIYVVDRRDGTLLSDYLLEDIKYGYEHCNSVVQKDGFIYFVATQEDGQGTVKLELSADGCALKEVWRNPEVINVFEGFEVVGNRLYTTMEDRKLVLLDTETGRIIRSVRSVFGGIRYADNTLYVYGHNGIVQCFTLKDGIPEFVSEMRIRNGTGQHFSYPVIADGVMYIRRGDALLAYAVF